ncbi:MAG: type II secretion system protein GspD, partial [Myxococcota bacterium]
MPTNSLVIRAAPAVFSELARVIGELDHIPARVGIEAHVWDVDTTNALELGFDALIPLILPDDPNDSVAFATIGNPASLLGPDTPAPFLARFTRKPLVIPIIGPDGNPTEAIVPEGAAQITASQGSVNIRAITSPYLLAASGEEQLIFAGDQVPIPVSSAAAATSSTGTTGAATTGGATTTDPFVTSQQIERQDVGVELRVKPIAVYEDVVTLELHIEVSSVAQTVVRLGQQQAVSDAQGPTLRKFNVDATVRLNSGAVVLIAAAPADATFPNETGVPFLKDIPILGWFFRSTRDIQRRRRIVAAVQVNEIHSPEEQRADTIVHRLAFERHALRIDPLRDLTDAPYALHVA